MTVDKERIARKPRVLVVGPLAHQKAGHHVTFPRLLAMGCLNAGMDVTLLFPQPLRLPLSEEEAHVPSLCLRERLPSSPWWWRELWPRLAERPVLLCALWIVFNLRREDYDLIYWADLEYDYPALLWLARLRLWRFPIGFTHHQAVRAGTSTASQLAELHYLFARRGVKCTMCIMSAELLGTARAALGRSELGFYVPHGTDCRPFFEEDRRAARQALGLSVAARVILVYGLQSTRKNLHLLADVLRESQFSRPLTVIFAGTHDPTWRHPFLDFAPAHPDSNVSIVMQPEFVSDADTRQLFAAADAIWCYYKSFTGASGVCMQAIGHGRMSLGVDQDEIGAIMRQWKSGLAIAPNDLTALSSALKRFVEMQPAEQAQFEAAARAASERFSWPTIARTLVARCTAIVPDSTQQ